MGTPRDGAARPSRTAQAVAAGRAIGYLHLHDPLAASFLPAAERLVVQRARRLAARTIGADAVAVATAGMSRHCALRMAVVDEAVAAATAAGCTQVVIVGAGYDTRAWRLASLHASTVWELDLPATQAAKRRGIAGRTGRQVVHFVEGDLSREPMDALLDGWDHRTDRPTMWVWEGVVPYLPPDAVAHTLDGIRACSTADSRLAMTVAHPDLLGPRQLAPAAGTLASIAFRILGEPIRSTYDEWAVSDLLHQHGFTDAQVSDTDAWARSLGLSARPDPLRAERLVTARVA